MPNEAEARREVEGDRCLSIVVRPGVRKVTYRDPDGNEIGFGGGPVV